MAWTRLSIRALLLGAIILDFLRNGDKAIYFGEQLEQSIFLEQ